VDVPERLTERIDRFRADLPTMSALAVVQRHITQGECYALDEHQHISLKTEIAQEFQIHPNEVVVVGSGKLGFSIVPTKRYRPLCDESDIDVAIVSPTLFDELWRLAFDYRLATGVTWDNGQRFADYLFRGWIRPDMLPPGQEFIRREHWFEFFRRLSSSAAFGRYRVNGGLYRSWYFLEAYQAAGVVKCQQEMRGADEDDLIG